MMLSTTETRSRLVNETLGVLYLLLIQTPFRVLWSGFLCKELPLVCIFPASDNMMPEDKEHMETLRCSKM